MGWRSARRSGFAHHSRMLLCVLVSAAISVSGCLSACSSSSASEDLHHTQDGKVVVRVSMYNSSSFPTWREYVEDQCPDVYIQWEDNRNACSNVVYEAEHDDMPDIVAIRRYESDSARNLEPYLADLSGLATTQTIEAKYLAPYADGGKQYWLPEPGTFDGIIANKTLFDQHGIALPTDLDSFISACKQLKALGIEPFAADLSQGFGCVSVIEGFGAASYLGTGEGALWRSAFDAGTAKTVDQEGYSQIAGVLQELVDASALGQDDLDTTSESAAALFANGKAAMIRASSDEIKVGTNPYDEVALPYFGQDETDSMAFTYPVFCLSMSKEASEDSERLAACTEVLDAMMSSDAQSLLSQGGAGLFSYSKDVTLDLDSSMDLIQPLYNADRCYIRSLNSNSFSASKAAMAALIAGGGEAGFVSTLDENLFAVKQPAVVGTSRIEASNELDEKPCSPAASVLAQTVCTETGTDVAIIDSREATAPIYKGEYTDADVAAITMASGVYTATLTGSQVRQLIEDCLAYTTIFRNGATEPLIDYPAFAGMTVGMEKDGTLSDVTMSDGNALNEYGAYNIAISERIYSALSSEKSILAGSFSKQDAGLVQCMSDAFASDGGLPEAGEYYVVR